jgi:hypothetical protein
VATSTTKNTWTRLRVTAQSTWKKSQTDVLAAGFEEILARGVGVALGRYPQALEHAADGRGGCPMSELEQLALDPVGSPARRSSRSSARSTPPLCPRSVGARTGSTVTGAVTPSTATRTSGTGSTARRQSAQLAFSFPRSLIRSGDLV